MSLSSTTTLSNLLFLIKEFNRGKSFTISEIAEKFNISRRTASRYVNNYLKQAEFDLKKKGHKIYLAKKISSETQVAISAIENFSKECGVYPKIKDFLRSLEFETDIIFTKLLIEDISGYFDYFLKIQKAIENRNKIKIKYKNKTYILKPLKLANFEGYWYLLAMESRYKTFHFKSIKEVTILNETYEKIDINLDDAINVWYNPFTEKIRVELLADKWVSEYLRRVPLNSTQKEINSYPDKSTLFEIQITDFMEIKWFIKRFIPQIKVISPKELKEEINKEIKDYLD
jgi:predicted DNA-binding transcriptional regulator YafY